MVYIFYTAIKVDMPYRLSGTCSSPANLSKSNITKHIPSTMLGVMLSYLTVSSELVGITVVHFEDEMLQKSGFG